MRVEGRKQECRAVDGKCWTAFLMDRMNDLTEVGENAIYSSPRAFKQKKK
jgi:hypothetical protein